MANKVNRTLEEEFIGSYVLNQNEKIYSIHLNCGGGPIGIDITNSMELEKGDIVQVLVIKRRVIVE